MNKTDRDARSAFASLTSSHDEPATAGLVPCALIYGGSCLAVRAVTLALGCVPWPSFAARLAAEAAAAVLLVDLVSGILHLVLDYCDPGPALRSLVARSKDAVHRTRGSDARYRAAGPWQQLVWNFQSHHAAPFPEHDDQLRELSLLVTPLLACTALQYAAGWLAPAAARVWAGLLALGYGVQASHFWAHQRVHLGAASLPPLVARLQDARLLLHPDVHRKHHQTFDTNFCIFNGWANPLLNALFRLAVRRGWVDRSCVLQVPPEVSPEVSPPDEQRERSVGHAKGG